jgi:CheY-like chemotaxis protein
MKLETLIADDDDMVIFLHKIAVVESGLSDKPVIARNGSQALDYVLKHTDTTFLVLLDINMPEMDGWEFLEAIQKLKNPKILVVMVTSSVDNRDRKKAKSYTQVIEYIEKPLTVDSCSHIKNLPAVAPLIGQD